MCTAYPDLAYFSTFTLISLRLIFLAPRLRVLRLSNNQLKDGFVIKFHEAAQSRLQVYLDDRDARRDKQLLSLIPCRRDGSSLLSSSQLEELDLANNKFTSACCDALVALFGPDPSALSRLSSMIDSLKHRHQRQLRVLSRGVERELSKAVGVLLKLGPRDRRKILETAKAEEEDGREETISLATTKQNGEEVSPLDWLGNRLAAKLVTVLDEANANSSKAGVSANNGSMKKIRTEDGKMVDIPSWIVDELTARDSGMVRMSADLLRLDDQRREILRGEPALPALLTLNLSWTPLRSKGESVLRVSKWLGVRLLPLSLLLAVCQ